VAFRKKAGFTLVELMISLVVAGFLMAGLVGMAGSMRRAFGHAKDVTDVQANLRFALMRVTDDLRRTAFMYLARPGDTLDPSQNCHLLGLYPSGAWSPTGSWDAIEYDKDNYLLTIRGNYSSSRDYLLRLDAPDPSHLVASRGAIICRNGIDRTISASCDMAPLGSEYDEPFADGQPFSKIFVTGQVFRLEAQSGRYTYHIVTSLPGDLAWGPGIGFQPTVNLASQIQGFTKWISPITTIQYQLLEKTAGNWVLVRRRYYGAAPQPDVELAEFLLPPTNDPNTSGFFVEIYSDNSINAAFCAKPWQPAISVPPISLAGPIDAMRARALRITIRGRSQSEDPDFVLTNYTTDSKALNYGFDLDGTPENGLALVRTQRTVVQLQNLGLNISM